MENKTKLKKNERLVGAYIVKEEPEFYKVSQLTRLISFRVHKVSALGMFIDESLKSGESGLKWLESMIVEKMTSLSCIPDEELLTQTMRSAKECMERHPQWYGNRKLSDEENKRILREMEEEYLAEKMLQENKNQG